jgi:PmbA protein
VEEILARAKKVAEEAEVFMVTSEETPVSFEANRLKHVETKESRLLALRIVKNGRVGYALSTDPDDRENLVKTALATAEFGTKAAFTLPVRQDYPTVSVFDPAINKVSLETMVGLGERLIGLVREHSPEVLCSAEVAKETASTRILNSRGGEIAFQQTAFVVSLFGQLIRETDMLFVGEGESSCRPITEIKKIAATVIRQLELAKNLATAPSKKLPVIFTPNGVTSALLSPLAAAFNGKTVLQGASPIGNKRGETVFDQKFSLADDPTIAYQPQSRPADDEGIPSRRTALIQEGVVANFFYDLQTAGLAGTASTGNAARPSGSLPTPAPSAFVVSPGKTPFEDMVSDIKEGLVIEELMGADQGNILSGAFSGNVLLGYKIENGRMVGRVKDTMVSGSIYELLKDIAAVGSDAKWVGGSVYTPSLYCPSLSVASK